MALVKVVSHNLFSGANLKKLEVGSLVDVEAGTAEQWVAAGLAEAVGSEKEFEVSTPEKQKKGK
ncbi:TPA: hypothetical protein SMI07_000724 [Serratia liquefaciens]|nr:hypothetical protein [Serratia liquefaciens]